MANPVNQVGNSNTPKLPPQVGVALTALRRHGPLVIALSLILAAGGMAAVWFTFEPVYEAKSFLHVIQNPEYFQIVPERNQTKTEAKNELAPLTSDLVLRDVLTNEEVKRQPSFKTDEMTVKELRKRIRFQSAGGQEHFEVVATSPHPKEAAVLVRTVTEAYLDFFRKYRHSRLLELSESLSSEIQAKNKQIEDVSREVSNLFREMQGSGQDGTLFDPDGEFLNELKKMRTEQQAEIKILQSNLEKLKSSEESQPITIDEAVITSMVEQSAEMKALRQRQNTLEEQRIGLSSKGAGHREVVDLEKQIQRNQLLIDNLKNNLSEQSRNLLVAQQKQQRKDAQAAIELEIAQKGLKVEHFEQEINKQQSTIAASNQKRAQHDMRNADLIRLRQEYNVLIDAESAIRLRQLSLPFQISRNSDAVIEVPTEPVEKYPIKLLAMAGAAGLFLPFVLAFLWEMRISRISDVEQMIAGQNLKLLGEVAHLPSATRKIGKQLSQRMTRQLRLYQESVDNLSALLSTRDETGPRVIAVTSASSHEGKSTLSSQLAISLARSHQGRILLLDTDLRSPTQHRLFNLELEPGLAEVVEQDLEYLDALRQVNIDGLEIFTAGRVKSNPRRCFSGDHWQNLLDSLRQQYDWIIVDTPPVLATSESMMISKTCDAAIVCLLRDVSLQDSVRRAHQRLQDGGVNVMGYVMSGIPQSEYAYRYGSYGYNLSR